jgi:hypothetical protein
MIESCWQVKGSLGRLLTCCIVDDGGFGVDLRLIGASQEDVYRSRRCIDAGQARDISKRWLGALIANGFAQYSLAADDSARHSEVPTRAGGPGPSGE